MGMISKWLAQGGGMGNFVVIVGPPHTGKTTILCSLFKNALKDFEVITTTRIFKPPRGLHFVNSASGLLKAYAMSEGNVIIAIDDAQATFDSTSMASTRAAKMNQTIYLFMAKIEANFIFVAHYFEKIPRPIRECEPLLIRAVKPGYMQINGRTVAVNKSPYDFPKAFIPSWRWDINPQALYDKLSAVKGKTNEEIIRKNKRVILEFLDDNPKEIGMSRRELAIFLMKVFEGCWRERRIINQQFVSELTGLSRSSISVIKTSVEKSV